MRSMVARVIELKVATLLSSVSLSTACSACSTGLASGGGGWRRVGAMSSNSSITSSSVTREALAMKR